MSNEIENRTSNPKITFFMLVTNYDAGIADYAVKSYEKLYEKYFDILPFKLVVYANRFSEEVMQEHFPIWEKYPYVEIMNNWEIDDPDHTERLKTASEEDIKLKKCAPEFPPRIWFNAFHNSDTPYWSSVDADFEILNPDFVIKMIEEMDKNKNLVCMSSDYHPLIPNIYEHFSKKHIHMAERWDTWFCIYKNEAKKCKESHFTYQFIGEDGLNTVWDDQGYFQKCLKDDFGYELKGVDKKYETSFIHYIAFSKNKSINKSNIELFRKLSIQERHGICFRSGIKFIDKLVNRPYRKAAKKELDRLFPAILKERYTTND